MGTRRRCRAIHVTVRGHLLRLPSCCGVRLELERQEFNLSFGIVKSARNKDHIRMQLRRIFRSIRRTRGNGSLEHSGISTNAAFQYQSREPSSTDAFGQFRRCLRLSRPIFVLVLKADYANRNPAKNIGHSANRRPAEEHDFERAHCEDRYSKSHDWRPFFRPKSFGPCPIPSISTVR